MTHSPIRLLNLGFIAIAVLGPVVSSWAKPKHLLVVTATQGFRHSSIPTAENVLATMGQQTGLWTVDYARGGADGKGDADIKEKMSPTGLAKYDAVVFANTTGDLPVPDKEAFLKWIQSGKGFVGMHSCSDTFHGFRPFIEMLGGRVHDPPRSGPGRLLESGCRAPRNAAPGTQAGGFR